MTEIQTNPFPGLRSFEPEEDHLFFGREEQIDGLLKRLRRTRFLTVVGSSGSGKSSLVRCGLIPGLLSGYMVQAGSYWKIAIMRPGSDPIGNLARALKNPMVFEDDLFGPDEDDDPPAEEESSPTESGLLEATLNRGSRGLVEAAKHLREDEHENLLVVVDQFEELFRFKKETRISGSQDTASAFVKLLLRASIQEDIPIYVVLTMRSDFLENCTEFRNLPEAINRGQYLVPRMTREQQRTAITGPVAVSGAEISPRLTTRLLNDVGDNPDQLPILQHALMRTWDFWKKDHSEGEPIDLRHYQGIGAMEEALSLHAEEAFLELRSPANKTCAEKMLKALTEKGQDGKGIRRPATVAAICEVTDCSEASVMLVAECFRQPSRSFLMPPPGTPLREGTVLDISHESLMRVWDRLKSWVDDESMNAKLYTDLAHAAAQFQDGTAGLWRDPELQLALRWKEETQPTGAWAERYDPTFERAMLFLDLSKKEKDRAIEVQERLQKRALRRSRLVTAASALAAIILLILAFYGYLQKQNADKRAKQAEDAKITAEIARADSIKAAQEAQAEKEKADQAMKELETANLELESRRNEAIQAAEDAQRKEQEALLNSREAERQKAKAERLKQTAEEQEKKANEQKLEAERQKELALEQTRKAQESEGRSRALLLSEFARILAGRVTAASRQDPQFGALTALFALSLSESRANPVHQAVIHEAMRTALAQLSQLPDKRFPALPDAVRAIASDPSGQRLFLSSGTETGNIYQLDLGKPSEMVQIPVEIGAPIRALALSPDGKTLAAGDLNGQIHLIDLSLSQTAPSLTTRLKGHQAAITALAFHSNQPVLASGGKDGRVKVWNLNSPGADPVVFSQLGNWVNALAISPRNGDLLVGSDAGLHLIKDHRKATRAPALLSSGNFKSVAYHPQDQDFAAGTADGTVELHSNGEIKSLRGHNVSPINALVFSPKGHDLASASSDHSIRIWNVLKTEEQPITLKGHDSWVWSLAYDQEGRKLFSGGEDRVLRSWTVSHHDLKSLLCKAVTRNFASEEIQDLLSSLPPESQALLSEDLAPGDLCAPTPASARH